MATDLIISFLSAVPAAIASRFNPAPLFLAVPAAPVGGGRPFYQSYLAGVRDGQGRVVPGLFKKAGGKGAIGRVAVMGFSNGVDSGVSQLLEASDAQKIDFVGCFDGIHGSFAQKPNMAGQGGVLAMATYNRFIAYARAAAAVRSSQSGGKAPTMVITHSSIEPPFPSTTESANAIWAEVMRTAPADYEAWIWSELDDIAYPGGMTIKSVDTAGKGGAMPSWTWQSFSDGWYDRRVCNGLSVFGWGDPGESLMHRIQARTRDRYNETADHIFQAKAVLPAVLEQYLLRRWNPACGPATSGLGGGFGDDVTSCEVGEGMTYDEGAEAPLPDPLPPSATLPSAPQSCPYPKKGTVLTGGKVDPCASSPPEVPPPPPPPGVPPPPDDEGFTWKHGLALAAGAGAGYGLVRALSGKGRRA